MKQHNTGHKEPLIRLSRREGVSKLRAVSIRAAALLLALTVNALLIFSVTKLNPLRVYAAMFEGAFGSGRRIWATVRDCMMLLCIGVGLAPAFKMKFWNIGAEGQVLVGGIATAGLMIYAGKGAAIPTVLLFLVMGAASLVCGALWGVIPAVFKAKWNTNETLFTLMMNYVAIQLTSFCVSKWENPPGSNSVGVINSASRVGWFPSLDGQNYSYWVNLILVLSIAVFMFLYLRSTKQGYEISVVGSSENTARYAGIKVSRVYIRTMALSGAICGLAGFIAVAGASHTISTDTAGGQGFTAIIVAWLAKFNTFTMILISLLLVFLEKGAIEIASRFQLNDYASQIITGILLFFILGSEFFINYRVKFRSGRKEAAKK